MRLIEGIAILSAVLALMTTVSTIIQKVKRSRRTKKWAAQEALQRTIAAGQDSPVQAKTQGHHSAGHGNLKSKKWKNGETRTNIRKFIVLVHGEERPGR